MNIFITGGTGFIGRSLINALIKHVEKITLVTRQKHPQGLPDRVNILTADPTKPGAWQENIHNHDCFINLAGAEIANRWTKKFKEELYQSRILTTRNLVRAITASTHPSEKTLISASAIGYYGHRKDEFIHEDMPPGSDFLAKLAVDWEQEAMSAKKSGVRVIITRFGVVLGKGGGALQHILPLFKKGLGGPVGDGKQWVSWIHLQDLIKALLFLKKMPKESGPFNITSPEPVRNKVMAHAIGKFLGKPARITTPSLMIKTLLGEASSVVLKGQRVIPKRLIDLGFQFDFPTIDQCLMDLIP